MRVLQFRRVLRYKETVLLRTFSSQRVSEALQELDILPNLKGIYKFDLKPPAVNAVFMSHGDLDHSAYLPFMKREVQVYCGETTQTILEILSQIRRADLEFSWQT